MSPERRHHLTLRLLAILLLWLVLALICGRISFAPWATDLLVDVTARLGIYGNESVENFYMIASLAFSLIVAILIVVGAERVWRRRGMAK